MVCVGCRSQERYGALFERSEALVRLQRQQEGQPIKKLVMRLLVIPRLQGGPTNETIATLSSLFVPGQSNGSIG